MKKPPPLRFHVPPEGGWNPTTPSCPPRQAERSPPEPGAGASAEEPRQGAGGRCQPPPPRPPQMFLFSRPPGSWQRFLPAPPQLCHKRSGWQLRARTRCPRQRAGRGEEGGGAKPNNWQQAAPKNAWVSITQRLHPLPNNSVPVNPRSRIKASNSPPGDGERWGGTGHRLSAAPRSCWACQENRAASCKLRVWGKTAA